MEESCVLGSIMLPSPEDVYDVGILVGENDARLLAVSVLQ